MASDVSDSLRLQVARRAGYRCEYCLLHEADSYSPHQIDHIISRKHGGASDESNPAFVCLRCNVWKGSDIGSLDPATGSLVPLFHPRRSAIIEPLTAEARATARLLKLNLDKRVVERRLLAMSGRYPG